MPDLASLTAAGDSASLPGFILSVSTLSSYGLCESEFSTKHILAAANAAIQLPPTIAEMVVKAADATVASGKFNYGTPGFDAAVFQASNLPFLLWVALIPKHPQVTRAQASGMLTPENEPRLSRAIHKLMGYSYKKKADPKPRTETDWKPILHALSKRGISPVEVSNMSIEQILVCLSADPDTGIISPEEMAKGRKKAATLIFDTLCAIHKLSPAELAALPIEDLGSKVVAANPALAVQPEQLRAAVEAYASEPKGEPAKDAA